MPHRQAAATENQACGEERESVGAGDLAEGIACLLILLGAGQSCLVLELRELVNVELDEPCSARRAQEESNEEEREGRRQMTVRTCLERIFFALRQDKNSYATGARRRGRGADPSRVS